MSIALKADVCIVGAGSGGLSVAAGTAQLGLKTVLIERDEMGGDCLNTGCVPSKALLAVAKRAHLHRKQDIKGIRGHEPEIDFNSVKDHVFDTIRRIEPNDSQERFEGLGVHVIRAQARFTGRDSIEAGEYHIQARHIVLATGSRPAVPQIPGLDISRIFTNESIFKLREKPDHLLIIGGGPIGIEMAQAHRRLGCQVSLIDRGTILPRDDQKNVEILRQALLAEGIDLHEMSTISHVSHGPTDTSIHFEKNGKASQISGSHLMVATGRVPNVDGLHLELAGVEFTQKGITVDSHLRTTNKKVFAIGDVSGGPQFTHVAGYHAGILIRQICFRMFWSKVDYKALPWVTYSDPELAQVGLTEVQARQKFGGNIKLVEWTFHENDRAIAERTTLGQIRVVTDRKGLILGASIVGTQAGEMTGLWALAIMQKLKIGAITGLILPYPTLGEISKRAAGAWFTPSLFSDKTRRLIHVLQKLP